MGWLDGRRQEAPFSPGTPSESLGLGPGPRGREGATLGFSGSEPHVKKGGERRREKEDWEERVFHKDYLVSITSKI